MKKLLLLLAAGSIALSAGAQALLPGNSSFGTVIQRHQPLPVEGSAMHNGHGSASHKGHRTTSATEGWFDYSLYMDTVVALGATSATATGTSAIYLWNDTTSQDAYSGGVTQHNNMVSYGMLFDPTFTGYHTYEDVPVITSTTPYWVDSVILFGFYGTNPAKLSVVDTLKVGYVTGSFHVTGDDIPRYRFTNPTLLANYSVTDTALFFGTFGYDSAANTGMSVGTVTPTYHEQIITISNNPSSNSNINHGDTLSNGLAYHQFRLNTTAAVPAGQLLGLSVSFKSGDASFVPDDVVFTSTGTYNYNMWRALIQFYSDGTNPVFYTYDSSDKNTGEFKTLPDSENGWGGIYIPNYAWTVTGGGASSLQFPVMQFHVTTTPPSTTGVANTPNLSNVHAVPNPAANFTFITFKLDAVSNVNVSFIDAAGHIVSTQNFDNVASGKAFINTTDLASGVYFYTVSANGKNSTGRVVVAH